MSEIKKGKIIGYRVYSPNGMSRDEQDWGIYDTKEEAVVRAKELMKNGAIIEHEDIIQFFSTDNFHYVVVRPVMVE